MGLRTTVEYVEYTWAFFGKARENLPPFLGKRRENSLQSEMVLLKGVIAQGVGLTSPYLVWVGRPITSTVRVN